MSDEIAFSGPGAPNLRTDEVESDPATPVFFDRTGNDAIEREISPADYATAKERAMRLDAIAGTGDGRAEQSAPVV